MKHIPDPGLFKPTQSRTETKSDMTTKLARQIVDSEATARIAKTERLRAARLAQEPEVLVAAPKKPARKRQAKRA
jgi:hypothetical protein